MVQTINVVRLKEAARGRGLDLILARHCANGATIESLNIDALRWDDLCELGGGFDPVIRPPTRPLSE